jgi:hypothetical protein
VVVQELGVLHIKIVLRGTAQAITPVRRHVLLISDNPPSAPPRQVVTAQDGTVDVRLRPGSYTVESDQPVAFEGRAYQWIQFVDVRAGSDVVLELTAGNAEVETATAAAVAISLDEDVSSLAARWENSVVGVWTPTAHASGFVIDADGLVVTNQRGIGLATSVEVQFSPTLKVAAVVVAADAARDVAVVRIDPMTAAAVSVVPLGCGDTAAALKEGDRIFVVAAPLGRQKETTSGIVRRVAAGGIESDIDPGTGGSGGPVFTARGTAVGITSEGEKRARQRSPDERIVLMSDVCTVVKTARTKLNAVARPAAAPLPVEPARPYPAKALEDMISARAGNLNPYQTSSADFDIAFLTPVHVHDGRRRSMATGRVTRSFDAAGLMARLVTDFSNWSEYVADLPPVLMIRVTPKLVEGFWTKLARGAAYTQGVALPPMKRLKSGFSRMQVFCGDAEITPIHPLVLDMDVSDTETIAEGLYVFDPSALSPTCANPRLSIYAQQAPAKADSRGIDARIIQQIWDDFAPYRAQP